MTFNLKDAEKRDIAIPSGSIEGRWKGVYKIKGITHEVELTIAPKGRTYEAVSIIMIDHKVKLIEELKYHNKLNGKEWADGNWIEFIGINWENDNEYLTDYWMDAYAVNKNLKNDRLQVKIWDNVNQTKQEVIFKRI